MTNPNMDCGQQVPEKVKFTVNLDFIPEGEEDLVQLDILYHYKKDVLFFLWKEFEKNGKILYLRVDFQIILFSSLRKLPKIKSNVLLLNPRNIILFWLSTHLNQYLLCTRKKAQKTIPTTSL